MKTPEADATPVRRRIVLTSETAAKAPEQFGRLTDAGFAVEQRFDLADEHDAEVLMRGIDGAWGVVANSSNRFDRATLHRLRHLRVIARTGVGYDAIDVAAATAHGVLVFTTPGTLTESVADFTLALMLGCLRDIVGLNAAVRSGQWRARRLGRDLCGTTVAIVGLGAIGQAVARRLAGFSCRVLAVDPLADAQFWEPRGVSILRLEDALPQADVVTVHVSLTPETRGLIGPRELALLRPTAMIVNTSRGAVLDEAALVDALQSGSIAGAALDVFEREPLPPDHALVSLDNVVLTGHAASSSVCAVRRMCDAVVNGVLAAAAGAAPAGCLNPSVLTKSDL